MLGIDWAKIPGMTSAKASVKASYFKSLFGIQGQHQALLKPIDINKRIRAFSLVFQRYRRKSNGY